jgi:hypothetical protein
MNKYICNPLLCDSRQINIDSTILYYSFKN